METRSAAFAFLGVDHSNVTLMWHTRSADNLYA